MNRFSKSIPGNFASEIRAKKNAELARINNKIKKVIVYSVSPKQFFEIWEKDKEDAQKIKNNIDWIKMSMYEKINEEFILDFYGYVQWPYIYKYTTLSENFIDESCRDYFRWEYIVKFQQLSEQYMTKYKSKLNFELVWRHQKYSEHFIKENINLVNWDTVSYITKITDPELVQYIRKDNNWLYLSDTLKLSLIKKSYEIVTINEKKYVDCFKVVRSDYSSIYSPHVKFNKLYSYYETVCDFNYNNNNSYGFSGWTYGKYCNFARNKKIVNFKILKIRIPLECCCWTGNFRSNKNFPKVSYSELLFKESFHYKEKIRCNKFQIINIDVENVMDAIPKKCRFLL